MRILLFPELYSSKHLLGISMVNTMLDTVRRTQGKAFWYMVVPPPGADFEVPDLSDIPNLQLLPYGQADYTATLNVIPPPPTDAFNQHMYENAGELPYDLILNAKYLHSLDVKRVVWTPHTRWRPEADIPIVTWYTETGLDKALPALSQDYVIMAVFTSLLMGSVVVMNKMDKDHLIQEARRLLSPTMVARARQWTEMIPPLVDWSQVDAHAAAYRAAREARAKAGVVHLFHGGTFEGKRHIPEMVPIVEKLRVTGHDIQLYLKTQWAPDRVKGEEYTKPFVNLETKVSRTRYLESLADGDVLVCCADYEGTGLAYLEAVRSGMTGVFLNRPWIAARLPPGYPFVAGSMDTLPEVILAAVRQPDLAREWTEKLNAHWDQEYGAEHGAPRVLAHCQRVVDEYATQGQDKLRRYFYYDPVKKFCDAAGDKFTFQELVEGARKHARSQTMNPLGFGKSFLRKAVLDAGFIDDCLGPEPSFIRKT